MWARVIAPIVVGLVLLGVPALVNWVRSEEPGPKIQALEPVVHNGPEVTEDVPGVTDPYGAPAIRQSEGSKARIEIRLKNNGDRQSVFTEGNITVRRQIVAPGCGIQRGTGPLRVSDTYDIRELLPQRRAQGRTIHFEVNHQVGPHDADRFVFTIGAEPGKQDVGEVRLYQLDMSVQRDGTNEPTRLGRVVLAFPGVRPYLLPVPSAQKMLPCELEDLKALRKVAKLRGVRSSELREIQACAGRRGRPGSQCSRRIQQG